MRPLTRNSRDQMNSIALRNTSCALGLLCFVCLFVYDVFVCLDDVFSLLHRGRTRTGFPLHPKCTLVIFLNTGNKPWEQNCKCISFVRPNNTYEFLMLAAASACTMLLSGTIAHIYKRLMSGYTTSRCWIFQSLINILNYQWNTVDAKSL